MVFFASAFATSLCVSGKNPGKVLYYQVKLLECLEKEDITLFP